MGGGAAGTTIAVVNKNKEQNQNQKEEQEEKVDHIQVAKSIWDEKFLNQLIGPIYHKNLIKQLNKELKQHNINEVTLVDSNLSDEVLDGKTSVKVFQNNNEIELLFGEFLPDEKDPTLNEEQTICTDMGWRIGKLSGKEFMIVPQIMPPSVKEVPNKLPWFINSLVKTFIENENVTIKGIEDWDTSNIQNMFDIFQNAKKFNQNIEHWDTSSARIIEAVFKGAEEFDQPLNNWDVSNVINFNGIFWGAKKFNQDLDKWDTSSAIQIIATFKDAENFNGNITTWSLKNTVVIQSLFEGAKKFNQDISTKEITKPDGSTYKAWDTSNVEVMVWTFKNAKGFNQDISNWNVEKVLRNQGVLDFSKDSGLSEENLPIGFRKPKQ
ncbi:BspA family leucine-rich repeat surface protein [Mycoplasma yeatsii]|uniref:BspA family leucine-rich repeat surface protein n=1 Tax=Mycoplasma yeatsii TaxID=51365 RepID=UPI0006968B15|nr:BspA family leucine-rich repeat surface protein [Mycoplasma yeatsii]